jgi:type II secretion system protein N
LGGTIDGSVTHKPSVTADAKPSAKKSGPHFDRTVKMKLDNVALDKVSLLRDAIGAEVGGSLKGAIEITYGESRNDHANGSIDLEIESFWVSDGKKPFKIPALKQIFSSEDITLPQMAIGNVPLSVSVKNGVARIEKFEAKGKDLDINADGIITLREAAADSELNLGLRFKFNDSYKKKGDATAGLLMMLDSEPKLRASKRPDGFYSLRVNGTFGAGPLISPAGASPAGMRP